MIYYLLCGIAGYALGYLAHMARVRYRLRRRIRIEISKLPKAVK